MFPSTLNASFIFTMCLWARAGVLAPTANCINSLFVSREVSTCQLMTGTKDRPNFKATLDGGYKLSIKKAYGGLMAVAMPAGNQSFQLRYVPWEFYVGLLLSLLGGAWGAWLGCAFGPKCGLLSYFKFSKRRHADE